MTHRSHSPRPTRHCLHRRAAAPALCLALLLAACGGATQGAGDDADSASVVATIDPQAAPLMDGHAELVAAAAGSAPADPGAHTRTGLYAQRAQALQLERTLRGDVIWVDVACCGTEGADLGVLIAFGMQAAGNLPPSVPVFVSGADLRLAASVVNRLADAGFSRVFLLTPARAPGPV